MSRATEGDAHKHANTPHTRGVVLIVPSARRGSPKHAEWGSVGGREAGALPAFEVCECVSKIRECV